MLPARLQVGVVFRHVGDVLVSFLGVEDHMQISPGPDSTIGVVPRRHHDMGHGRQSMFPVEDPSM